MSSQAVDDLLAQLELIPVDDGEIDGGWVQEEMEQMPEIERLKSFIKELEEEIAETRVIASERKRAEAKSVDYESDEEFATMSEEGTPPVYSRFNAKINIDEFLESVFVHNNAKDSPSSALKQAASKIDMTSPQSSDIDRLAFGEREVINFSVDSFFSSAQDEDDDNTRSPLVPSDSSLHTPVNEAAAKTVGRVKSFRVQEDFTVESLRRNWDREERLSANIQKLTEQVFTPQKIDPDDALDANASIASPSAKSSMLDNINNRVHSPLNKASLTIKDERIRNDFLICSIGEKLSNAYIYKEYVGLYPTEVTHYNDNGKLVPSPIQHKHYRSAQSTAANSIMNTLTSFDPTQHVSSSSSMNSGSAAGSSKGFYNVHIVECIIRPDIELKAIMALLIQISKQFQCKIKILNRNHMTFTPLAGLGKSSLLSRLSFDLTAKSDGKIPFDNHEFDSLDIQICISKAVRQRVILLQFMKRVGAYNNTGLGNMLMSQLSGPIPYLQLKQCPETKKLMGTIRKELIGQEINFSSLYQCSLVKVCALAQGLDAHYLAQLHSVCKENMWERLDLEYQAMEEHVQQEEEDLMEFIRLLEPIYKLYSLSFPPKDSIDGGARDINTNYDPSSDKVEISPRKRISSLEENTGGEEETMPLPSSPGRSKDRIIDTMNKKNFKMDGMTFCLIMVDQVYQELQTSCDEEYGVRLQKKHNATVAAIQEKVLYKRVLLTNLFNNPTCRSTSFHQTFVQLFSQMPIATATSLSTTNNYTNNVNSSSNSSNAIESTAPSSSGGKGWFVDLGSTVQQWSTNCLNTLQIQPKLISNTADSSSTQPNTYPKNTNSMSRNSKENENKQTDDSEKVKSDFQLIRRSTSKSDEEDYEEVRKESANDVIVDHGVKLSRSVLLFYCACLVGVRVNVGDDITQRTELQINNMQSATCYITPYYFCVATSNNLLFNMVNNSIQIVNNNVSSIMSSLTHKSKEVYNMKDLDEICLHRAGTNAKRISKGGIDRESSIERKNSVIDDGVSVQYSSNALSSRVVAASGMMRLRFFNGGKEIFISPIVIDAGKLVAVLKEVQAAFLS